MSHVLLNLGGLDQEAESEDLLSEVPLVERLSEHDLVESLELGESELLGQELEADRGVADLALEPFEGLSGYVLVVEGQSR